MKSLQLVFLFVVGALFLSQISHAAEDTSTTTVIVTIVSITPEAEAVDSNSDGKITLGECMSSAKVLFPEETAEKHAAIAKGCLLFLQEQQAPGSSPTGEKNKADELMAQTWSKRVLRAIGVHVTFTTPETKAVDANRDGKVSINECMASAKQLFPEESAEKHAAIAHGCLLSLQKQQAPGSFTTSLQNSADILMSQTWADRVLSSAGVVIVYITPEANAVDVNNDGKVTLDECLASAKQLFPEETAKKSRGHRQRLPIVSSTATVSRFATNGPAEQCR